MASCESKAIRPMTFADVSGGTRPAPVRQPRPIGLDVIKRVDVGSNYVPSGKVVISQQNGNIFQEGVAAV